MRLIDEFYDRISRSRDMGITRVRQNLYRALNNNPCGHVRMLVKWKRHACGYRNFRNRYLRLTLTVSWQRNTSPVFG